MRANLLTYILIFIASIITLDSYAQRSKFIYENFTIQDGLPSNECHEIFEDSKGYIWIATDNGMSRYDGNKFKKYGIKDGLEQLVIFEIQEDHLGNIWVTGLSGKIFIYNYSIDSFLPYRFNDVIAEHIPIQSKGYFEKMILRNDSLIIPIDGLGILTISGKGKVTIDSLKHYTGVTFKVLYDDIFVYSGASKSQSHDYYYSDINIDTLFFSEIDFRLTSNLTHLALIRTQRFNDFDLMCLSDYIYVKNRTEIKLFDRLAVADLSKDRLGNPVIGYLGESGARMYSNIKNNIYETLLDEISITGFVEDRDGGYWLSSLSGGIFYNRNPKIKYAHHELKGKNYNHITTNGRNMIFVSNYSGELISMTDNETLDIQNLHTHEITLLSYDIISNRLWWNAGEGLNISDSSNSKRTICENYSTIKVNTKDIYFDDDMTWGVGSTGEIVRIDNDLSKITRSREIPGSTIFNNRPNTIFLKDSALMVGGISGISMYNVNNLKESTVIKPFSGLRIEKISAFSDSTILVATQGKGLGFYSEDGSINYINETHGLISDNIEDAFVSQDNSIWVASLKGISKITLFEKDSFEIQNYTTSHGLPCSDVYEITELNGLIYAASGNGIITIERATPKSTIYKPMISSSFINGIEEDLDQNNEFEYDQNDIQINFITLNKAHSKNMLHRHRLNKKVWKLSSQNTLMLSNLAPDKYKLEVQSQNQDGEWSESMMISFYIKKPWWKTWWFLGFLFLSGLFSISIMIIRYKDEIIKKNKISEEIRSLEKSALQAQMNPHFIFNCLNSIQGFIMDNDKEQAMEYLGGFAQLIRSNLNASISDKISLDEECRILSNYLKLERLRLNNSFEYEISLPTNKDAYDIKLPPMLIQPFVENAVIHGMKNGTKNGSIKIKFNLKASKLHVEITDNGKVQDAETKRTGHKSVGIEITRKRLNFINKSHKSIDHLSINHTHSGTIVKLSILVDHQ
ncbi:MAG: ligand-binding sensor domain-containing protein [Halioglobus sp.]|jgi:ligand-binding sensor domain-containing protein